MSKKERARLRELAPAASGGITQPSIHLFYMSVQRGPCGRILDFVDTKLLVVHVNIIYYMTTRTTMYSN